MGVSISYPLNKPDKTGFDSGTVDFKPYPTRHAYRDR